MWYFILIFPSYKTIRFAHTVQTVTIVSVITEGLGNAGDIFLNLREGAVALFIENECHCAVPLLTRELRYMCSTED